MSNAVWAWYAAAGLLSVLVLGSWVYCLLACAAAIRYRRDRVPPNPEARPLSVLKPLAGAEPQLYENLRSFFVQDHPSYEIVFAVRDMEDAAAGVVQRLRREFPYAPARLVVTGPSPYPNAKVFALQRMMAEARHPLIVMSDSDIRVEPDFLRVIDGELTQADLVSCPYRAVPVNTFWSRMEALTLNTEFLAGILTARMLEGVRFALGPTIATSKEVVQKVGGWDDLKNYLAEDFVLGQRAAAQGDQVRLSSAVIEHHIGGGEREENLCHRLRWNRSTRRSRPAGYLGQIFTNPIPLALLLCLIEPLAWPAVIAALALRAAVVWLTAEKILDDRLSRRNWFVIPLADLLSFVLWIAGFFGTTILWRGRKFRLRSDGTVELLGKD